MKRLLTFSATRRIFLSTLIVAGLALLALMWKGALPGSTSAARQPVSSPVAMVPPVPVLDLNVQGMEFPSQALIGETFCYTARFDNTGGVGYGPYVEIVLPPGLTLESAGLPGVCDTGDCTQDDFYPIPPIQGTGNAYLIKAPIGSLYDTEPFIDLKICVKVDENIALGVPVTVCHTPVFEFGDAPLGGTPVIGTPLCPTVTPTVVILTKRALNYTSNKLPNDPTVELPTGLCNKVAFELVANIADTKTLEMIRIEDHLPPGMTLVNGSVTILNAIGGNTNCTDYGSNFVCADIPTETGTPGLPPYDKEDIIIRFEAYANNNVLNQANCNSVVLTNIATLDAKYNQLNIPQQTSDLLIEVEHVTVQKTTSVQFSTDPLHVVPGDTVIYALNFQVSENVNTTNVVITDTIPNGIDINAGSNAVLSCPGLIPSLITIGISPTQVDGSKILTIPVGIQPSCRKCTLTFPGVVQQKYRMPILDQNVLASDSLIPSCGNNPTSPLKCTNITYNINGGISGCMDDTAGGVVVYPTRIGKEVLPPIDPAGFMPGEEVTFKLKMCVESGDTQSVEFTDYLPSPIFQVDSINDIGNLMVTQTSGLSVNPTVTASFPGGDNSIKFTITPTLLTTNTIRSNDAVCFEVKFSAVVTYEPFDDNLFLTNIFPSKNVLTNGEEEGHFTGAIIHVRAPKLKVTKGVYETDNPFANNLSGLPDTAPYDSNATGVDANDTITYYVTVTNDGGAPAVGVSVTDALPAGMKIVSYPMPVGGSPSPGNTCKLNGNPITCPLPGSTIPPGLTVNAFYNTNSLQPGQSWIFKIELMLPVETPPCQTYTNSASATWSSFVQTDVKPDPIYTTPFPSTDPDSATITTAKPKVTKTVQFVGGVTPTANPPEVAIGQQVFYKVEIRVPEASFSNFVLTDTLPPGMKLDGVCGTPIIPSSITHSPTVFTCTAGGTQVVLNLGNVTNTDTNNSTTEIISFTFGAILLNETGNVNGVIRTNTATLPSTTTGMPGLACGDSSSVDIKVVEPKLKVTKTVAPVTADAGDTLTYTVNVMHDAASTATAYDVVLSDLVPAGQTYQVGSLFFLGCSATSFSESFVGFTINWSSIPLGTQCSFRFTTVLNNSAKPCQLYFNTADLTWTSLQGPFNTPFNGVANACERTGPATACGQLNNYISTSGASGSVPAPMLTKSFDPDLPVVTSVTIGQEFGYELKVCLPDGTTPGLLVTDPLPPGLEIVSATLLPGVLGAGGPLATTAGCGSSQSWTFTGPFNVTPDGNPANNCATIKVRVRVCDIPGNSGMTGMQTVLSNSFSVNVLGTDTPCSSGPSNVVSVPVVEPKLDVKKQFSPGVAAPNSTAQITITVTNNGTSPAYELLLQDVLNGCLSYVSGIAPPGFNVQPNGGSVTVTGASLAVGASITITITVQVGDCCSVPNTATGSASSLPGQVTGERTVTASGSDTLIVTGMDCPCYDLAQPSALAAWFHFDETSGTTANDIGGITNNLGTFGPSAAAPTITSGIVKNALLFDGNDDYVQAANDNELNIRGACNTNDAENYTIDAWIQSDGVGTQTIVDKRVGFIFTGYVLFLNSGRLAIQINNQNYATPTSLPVLTDNQWHFIAVTVQRCPTPQAKFYVDGDLVHTATLNATATNSMVNSEPLYIGTRSLSVGSGANFKGKLDELEIFKRVLSEEELDLIYAAGAGGKCKCVQPPQNASMTGWWPMNELAGDPFASDIKSGNNGVQVPAGAIGSPNVTPITGVVKGAFRFPLSNQSDKYLNVADNVALDFGTGSFTIECWLRPITAASVTIHPIVDKLNADNNSGYAFYVQNQQLKFVLGGNVLGNFSSNAGVVTLNEWQHVGVVVDRTGNAGRFVRNGVTVGTFTPTAGNSDNNVSMFIGGSRITFPPPSFAITDLDELEIFKAALTNAELALLYNAGGMGKCPPTCDIGPAMLPNGSPGTAYNQQLTLSGCPGTVVWSVESGTLPPGLSLNTSTGVISGTPIAGGSSTFTIKAVCSNGCMATKTYTVTIDTCVYNIDPISASYDSGGGTGTVAVSTSNPCGWAAISSVPWVNITSGATGTGNGTVGYSVAPNPLTQSRVTSLTIAGLTFMVMQAAFVCPVITVTPATLNNGRVNQSYNQTFTASGATGPYSFTRVTGTLPPGLTLATSGALTGTPMTAGSFNFTVQATDAGGCSGQRVYTLVIDPPCLITVNPAAIPNGFVGTAYNQTFTASGGTGPYSFTRVTGTLPPGLTLATSGALTGIPTTVGTFTFMVRATDASGCFGERDYTVIIGGSGLQFYPLPATVRALETRPGFSGCTIPGAPIQANTTFTLAMRTGCTGIPANATAVTGNITVVPTFSAGGYLTLFPSNAAQPVVANSNFQPFEITNNVFTVGLGPADGAFKIFASATTHVVVDVTGYFAPPSPAGLYFHPLNEPVRLVETRTLPGLLGCIKPGVPFPVGSTDVQGRSPVASPCNVIPATAQVLVGNATTVFPPAGGFLTLYSSDAIQPLAASSNYAGGDVINGPFAVKLGADGKFKVFTPVATDLVIDILGYYSTDAVDANGAGLLFTILPKPVRELETRPDFPGFPLTGCFRTNAPIQGGPAGIRTQQVWGVCDGLTIPNTARAILGNVTVVNPIGAGYLTFYPGNVPTAPTVATSNYPFPVIFGYNRHFFVGLSPTDGTFKILTSVTTDLIVDVSGYFAP